MLIRLLGTAAGGGFPQWNCRCAVCEKARTAPSLAPPRTQSCVAVSAEGKNWFLLNASPDVRHQIEAFSDMLPAKGQVRGSPIEGILVTNADLDHVLGLFILREGKPLNVYAPPAVQEALAEGLRLSQILDSYCGIQWQGPPKSLSPLLNQDRTPSGLLVQAFTLPGKMPRYYSGHAPAQSAVGYRLVDKKTGGRLVFIPDIARFDEEVLSQLKDCDVLLLDGTFWTENEMGDSGAGNLTASQMAHLPVGGPQGSLAQIAPLPIGRKIYIHINNTNPMLLEDSAERAQVKAAGVEVGMDGTELFL